MKEILTRNAFLSFWGLKKVPDFHESTIQYLKLAPKDSRYFGIYIESELLSKEAMPDMNDILKKKISEGIYEIFENAKMHSETREGIFTCGQYFLKKNKIEFMITDLGIGMREKINKEKNYAFNAIEAINWAMQANNTTKTSGPGGLGLKILKEFIYMNKGQLQVVSNNGYWGISDKGVEQHPFNKEFPGTAINISINTNDKCYYYLSHKINDDELF